MPETTEEVPEPCYAFLIPPTSDQQYKQWLIEMSCQVCGHFHLRAGDMCPRCQEDFKLHCEAMGTALSEHLELCKRGVHVYGVGLVDPWTREGKQHLDP
jgi:hypothetical protein